MHPDRRRRGRQIRRQRRIGTLRVAFTVDLTPFAAAVAAAATTMQIISAAAIREAHDTTLRVRLFAITSRNWPHWNTVTLESKDMTTVIITAPADAPTDLVDHLTTFVQELHSEGIDAHLDLTGPESDA